MIYVHVPVFLFNIALFLICNAQTHIMWNMFSTWTQKNFCAPTPNQDAIALCLQKAKEEPYYDDITDNEYQNYYAYLASEYLRKRDILLNTIQKHTPMTPVIPSGGFFIMADTSNIANEMYPTFSSYLNDSTEGKLKWLLFVLWY